MCGADEHWYNYQRVRQTIFETIPVIDIDESPYLHQTTSLDETGMHVESLDLPSPPLTGWKQANESNVVLFYM